MTSQVMYLSLMTGMKSKGNEAEPKFHYESKDKNFNNIYLFLSSTALNMLASWHLIYSAVVFKTG